MTKIDFFVSLSKKKFTDYRIKNPYQKRRKDNDYENDEYGKSYFVWHALNFIATSRATLTMLSSPS